MKTAAEMIENINAGNADNAELEVKGYVYGLNCADTDNLFDEIAMFCPYAQWFSNEEITEEDKRDGYDVLIKFRGVLSKDGYDNFRKIFTDIPSERYSITYVVVNDNNPPTGNDNPENGTPNDNDDAKKKIKVLNPKNHSLTTAELKAAAGIFKDALKHNFFDVGTTYGENNAARATILVKMVEVALQDRKYGLAHHGFHGAELGEQYRPFLKALNVFNIYTDDGTSYLSYTHYADLDDFNFSDDAVNDLAVALLEDEGFYFSQHLDSCRPAECVGSKARKTWRTLIEKIHPEINATDSIAAVQEVDELLAKAQKEVLEKILGKLEEVENADAEDDGSNDDYDEEYTPEVEAKTIDDEDDELADEYIIVKSTIEDVPQIYTAVTYIFRGGTLRATFKEFKNAVSAYKYLKRKVMRYSGITDFTHTIESPQGHIYENCNGNETTTNPEIQALIDKWNAEIDAKIELGEWLNCIAYYSVECAATPEALDAAVDAEIENAKKAETKELEVGGNVETADVNVTRTENAVNNFTYNRTAIPADTTNATKIGDTHSGFT